MTTLPQVLVNVELERPVPATLEHLDAAVAAATHDLGDRGRVVVRRSGTEPLVRVMVEADDEAWARAVADELADEAERHYGVRSGGGKCVR